MWYLLILIICIGNVFFGIKRGRYIKRKHNDYYQGHTILYQYDGSEWNRESYPAVYLYHDKANIYLWEFGIKSIVCIGSANKSLKEVQYNKFISLFISDDKLVARVTVGYGYLYTKISQICTSAINNTEYIHIREDINFCTRHWHTFTHDLVDDMRSPYVCRQLTPKPGWSVITPTGYHITFNMPTKNCKMSSYWYHGYFIYDGRAYGFPNKNNVRNLQPLYKNMTTFLVWCLNQPSKFSDRKYTYYCPVNILIEYILSDVLLKLGDSMKPKTNLDPLDELFV